MKQPLSLEIAAELLTLLISFLILVLIDGFSFAAVFAVKVFVVLIFIIHVLLLRFHKDSY